MSYARKPGMESLDHAAARAHPLARAPERREVVGGVDIGDVRGDERELVFREQVEEGAGALGAARLGRHRLVGRRGRGRFGRAIG